MTVSHLIKLTFWKVAVIKRDGVVKVRSPSLQVFISTEAYHMYGLGTDKNTAPRSLRLPVYQTF